MTERLHTGRKCKHRLSKRWLPASYTVEASWIMAISMGILLFAILCGYELFEETLGDVSRTGREISCVELFRAAAAGRDIAD